MLNKKQNEILQIANEECAEVVQAISKIFRFGIDTEWKGIVNRDHLAEELGDLQAMIYLMVDEGIVNGNDVQLAAQKKREKLFNWSTIFKD